MNIGKLVPLLLASCLALSGCDASVETQTAIPNEGIVENVETVSMSKPSNRMTIAKNFLSKQMERINIDVYNDPGLHLQYVITETNANLAWAEVEQKETITIAIIDTGVDYTHEDLVNRVDLQNGYDFVNNDSDPMDDNGHGTHVAGIIAAEADNNIGIVGIVGNLDVKIVPIKALDENGGGIAQNIADAIDYATELEVDIINLSLGTEGRSKSIDDAVTKAIEQNIFVVAASGNDGTLTGFASPVGVDGVLAVGATNRKGEVASFSNYGINIDIGACGENIISTFPNNQYVIQSGTSMATPVVTGAVAILLAEDPTLSIDTVYDLLCNHTQSINETVVHEKLWFGIVDIYQSLVALNEL